MVGCKEAGTQDRFADEPVVFEFSHCLQPGPAMDGPRQCVDTLINAAGADDGHGCLVVEVDPDAKTQAVPFTFDRGGVAFEEDARLILTVGQTARSAAFFFESGSDTSCVTSSAPSVDDDCSGRCVFKMQDVGGVVASGQSIKFLDVDGGCDVSWREGVDSDEFCDELDNDCDGLADEGLGTEEAEMCTEGIGACARTGQFTCGEDGRIVCNAIPGAPQNETEDGTDEDCDGEVDEGLTVACGEPGSSEPCPNIVGLDVRCATAVRICQDDGRWGACVDADGEPLIVDEVCDGLDNDCDGDRDEDFGGRGDIFEGADCAMGSGRCRSEGVWVCGPMELSCNAPTVVPNDEICDGQDNDCDGRSDEAAPQVPLSRPCYSGAEAVAGVGECNFGVETCVDGEYGVCTGDTLPADEVCAPVGLDEDCDGNTDESGQNACGFCGVLPPESCNLVDDDCDGAIDEDFDLTEATSCGSCENDCTDGAENAQMECVGAQCVVAACDLGFQDSDRDPSNGCECNGAVEDEPDPDFIDSDCDGLDGSLGGAIFVHPNGNDANNVGSADQPMRTIEAAVLLAQRLEPAFDRIYISEGSFRLGEFVEINGERVLFEVPDGFRLHGGFRRAPNRVDWSRHPRAEARTIIYGSQVALRFSNLSSHTMIDNLELRALDSANQTPSSSVGVFAKNVGQHLHLRDVLVRSGRGGDGVDGSDGRDGFQGGRLGSNGVERGGGSGGEARLCEGSVLSAGSGGDGGLPGRMGESGGVPLDNMPSAPGGMPGQDDIARNGIDGADGESGANGSHGRADGQIGEDGLWVPANAGDGAPGMAGSGGGGGAGLQDVQIPECSAGGGGGGGGGCPGTLGTGGNGGFGSIGLLVMGGSVRLENVEIVTDEAGDGGDGGDGGSGVVGGDGGLGASYPAACPRGPLRAGRGGDGGDGSCGGHGAGAAGGPSISILRVAPRLGAMARSSVVFVDRDGAPLPDQGAAATDQLSFGAAGAAGDGGHGNGCDPEAPAGRPGVAVRIGCCHAGPGGGPCGGRDGEELTCDLQ